MSLLPGAIFAHTWVSTQICTLDSLELLHCVCSNSPELGLRIGRDQAHGRPVKPKSSLASWLACLSHGLVWAFYSSHEYVMTTTRKSAVAMGEMYAGLDKYGTSKLVSRFVVPVCSAMKGDGPAVFIASACVFVAQQTGVGLDAGKIIFIAKAEKKKKKKKKKKKEEEEEEEEEEDLLEVNKCTSSS
nr:hypothetical transcript [Hymenolepis microstoma]